MSRSKRAPYWVDGYGSKWKPKAKQRANRKVRNALKKLDKLDNIAPGEFKKMSNSWDICDFKFHDPKGKKVKWVHDDGSIPWKG